MSLIGQERIESRSQVIDLVFERRINSSSLIPEEGKDKFLFILFTFIYIYTYICICRYTEVKQNL